MLCEVCQTRGAHLTWVGGPTGTLVFCRDCGDLLQGKVLDLTERLRSCTTLEGLLAEILRFARVISAADRGNIQLVNGKGSLRICAQNGFSQQFLDFFSEVKENEAACGVALARRQTVVVEDVMDSPIFVGTPALKILLDDDIRAVQSTPIFDQRGRLIGIFSTHYRQPHTITAQQVQLLTFLARQAGVLIEKLAVPLSGD